MHQRDSSEKVRTVLEKNTFFYYDPVFEEDYDAQNITSLANLLYNLEANVRQHGTRKEFFDELLQKPKGLRAVLALNGFSVELLKRVITVARVVNDENLDKLLLREKWSKVEEDEAERVSEWGTNTIEELVRTDSNFRAGIVNLFFEGASNPLLSRALNPFHLKKLSISKLDFTTKSMIDTLLRYREAGAYNANPGNNPEVALGKILGSLKVTFEKGDLRSLVESAPDQKRTLDFIIPNKIRPKIIVECSHLRTTSSGQGDKSKTEINIRTLLKEHYPDANFVGFVDGIGWYVRRRDLMRMVAAYDDVFTFHEDELKRFKVFVIEVLDL
jgi:hypothetical protein